MTTDFLLPDIGEGIVECELLEWLVKEGEEITEDQPVAEVMTDKVTVQIPSVHNGVVASLYYQPGDIAKVHQPLFAIDVSAGSQDQATSPSEDLPTNTPKTSAAAPTQAEDFLLPDIGEGIVECEIVKWVVEEGQQVVEDEVVVEVMTDKAVVEIPSKYNGHIVKLYHQVGEIAKVHQPLFAISKEGSSDSATIIETPIAPQSAVTNNSWSEGGQAPKYISGKVLASPAVRRLAREQQLDLNNITGSGKKGRILKCDLVDQRMAKTSSASVSSSPISPSLESPQDLSGRTVPIKGIQAAMAKQMSVSVSTVPHFTVSDELRMDALISLRSSLKDEFAKSDVKLSFMPFFIKALSMALSDYPVINSRVNDTCTEMTYLDDHNIGVAVDTPNGLMVPNIKQVQRKSVYDIAVELQQLIDNAKVGRLSRDSLSEGTITLSNIGVLGGKVATPIINYPEVAIAALGKTQTLPRFNASGEVEAHNIMEVSWSGDHRIIDGATMVRFNNRWFELLENPHLMLAKLA